MQGCMGGVLQYQAVLQYLGAALQCQEPRVCYPFGPFKWLNSPLGLGPKAHFSHQIL